MRSESLRPLVASAWSTTTALVLLWLLVPTTVLAGEIAALPVDSPGLLPGVRENLDMQLQAALVDAGYGVQDAEKTKRFVRDAVDAGLSCSLSDDECALKAGIAAGVDAVVVVRAVTVEDKLVVELRSVSVEGLPTRGAAGLGDSPVLLAQLARRLKNPEEVGLATALPVPLGVEPETVQVRIDNRLVEQSQPAGKPPAVLWLAPGPHLLEVSAAGYDTQAVVVDVKGDRVPPALTLTLKKSFPLLQVGAGVGGGVLTLACLVGVALVEGTLAQPQEPATRAGLTTLGRVLLGGAVVGMVAASTGTALALVGGGE